MTGPIEDKSYPGGVMVPMGSNTNDWIADIASYVRNSFGNTGAFVTPEQVATEIVRLMNEEDALVAEAVGRDC